MKEGGKVNSSQGWTDRDNKYLEENATGASAGWHKSDVTTYTPLLIGFLGRGNDLASRELEGCFLVYEASIASE